jgi:tryptophan-rich sensory protein
MPLRRQLLGLAGWLALTSVAAALGAAATLYATAFYGQLAQPGWAPPAWLFGPVWSALYLLMAVAAWLLWRAIPWRTARPALTLFVIQLAVNALWSWLFFAWRQGALALVGAALLWLLIAATLIGFARLRATLAAALLVPYLAWVGFAVALTWSVWQGNPGQL